MWRTARVGHQPKEEGEEKASPLARPAQLAPTCKSVHPDLPRPSTQSFFILSFITIQLDHHQIKLLEKHYLEALLVQDGRERLFRPQSYRTCSFCSSCSAMSLVTLALGAWSSVSNGNARPPSPTGNSALLTTSNTSRVREEAYIQLELPGSLFIANIYLLHTWHLFFSLMTLEIKTKMTEVWSRRENKVSLWALEIIFGRLPFASQTQVPQFSTSR